MLYEQLSEQEIQMIENYIDLYATNGYTSQERAPLKRILRQWENNKINLFNLFGHQLIISKNIEVSVPRYDLLKKMRNLMRQYKPFRDQIMRIYRSHESEYYDWNAYMILDSIFDAECLASNSVFPWCEGTISLPDNKTLRVQPDMKAIKVISKIAQAFGIEDFEAFRIEHSKILNTKTMRGKLCLSIHPLDYMTMSDNNCNWTSCMSWNRNGGYRLGTVEMMNSPVALVAYLTADEPYVFPEGEWNSKKWRSLFLATPDLITSVKGYPYQSPELVTIILEWLNELSEVNLDKRYQINNPVDLISDDNVVTIPTCPEPINIYFTTGDMYNDFGNVKSVGILAEGFQKSYLEIHYSGPTTCMWCGEEHCEFEDEGCLICCDCNAVRYCECCGDLINSAYHYVVDGSEICEHCYYTRTSTDSISGELILNFNAIAIYCLTPKQSVSQLESGDVSGIARICISDAHSATTLRKYFNCSPRRCCSLDFDPYGFYFIDDLTDEGIELFFGKGTKREYLL